MSLPYFAPSEFVGRLGIVGQRDLVPIKRGSISVVRYPAMVFWGRASVCAITRIVGAMSTRSKRLATSAAWSERSSRQAGWLRLIRSNVELLF